MLNPRGGHFGRHAFSKNYLLEGQDVYNKLSYYILLYVFSSVSALLF
jgi:hypothetical protein